MTSGFLRADVVEVYETGELSVFVDIGDGKLKATVDASALLAEDECRQLVQLAEAGRLIEELQRLVDQLQSESVVLMQARNQARRLAEEACDRYNKLLAKTGKTGHVTCAFCGHRYEDGTSESQNTRLTEHIRECQKHPIRDMERQLAQIRSVLKRLRLRWGVSLRLAADAIGVSIEEYQGLET